MTVAGVTVDLLHEMEKNFGPRVREIVFEMTQNQEVSLRDDFRDPRRRS